MPSALSSSRTAPSGTLSAHAPPSPSPLTWYRRPVELGTHLYVWSYSHPLNGVVLDKEELHAQVERAFAVGIRFARNNLKTAFVYRTENKSIRGASRAALIVDNDGHLQVAGFQSQEYNLSTSLAYKAGKRPPPQLEKEYVIVDEVPAWALHSDYDDATVYGEKEDWFEKESEIVPGELAWRTGVGVPSASTWGIQGTSRHASVTNGSVVLGKSS